MPEMMKISGWEGWTAKVRLVEMGGWESTALVLSVLETAYKSLSAGGISVYRGTFETA